MSKVGKGGMSHDRSVLLLNQSLRFCTVDDVVDALVDLKSLEDSLEILDRVMAWHQARLREQAARLEEAAAEAAPDADAPEGGAP